MIDDPYCHLEELITLGLALPLGPGEAICDLRQCAFPALFLTPDAAVCGGCANRLGIEAIRWHRPIPAAALTGGEDARQLRAAWYRERLDLYTPVPRTPAIDEQLADLAERAVRRSLELEGYPLLPRPPLRSAP